MSGLKKKTALLVDDRGMVLKALQFSLEHFGMETASAKDGHEALRKAQKRQFDIIILDIDMPGLSGFEVSHELKKMKNYSETPILFHSGRVDKRAEAETLGHFLAKPADLKALRKAIEKALDAHNHHRSTSGYDDAICSPLSE